MIVKNVAVDMKNMETAKAPIYTAVTQAKKRAKKPPAAANDIRREMTIALTVAATKKSINTTNPVKAMRVIVPTYNAAHKPTGT